MTEKPKITSKMRKIIKIIENNLNIKFYGKSFSDAKDFIDKNIEDSYKVDTREKRSPTQKQIDCIRKIEEDKKIKFRGRTMKEASDFIGKNIG